MTEVQEAAIERACTRLVIRYARATDAGDGAAAAECFTEGGCLEMPGGRVFAGRREIARRIDEQPPAQTSRHLLSNSIIEPLSETAATGRHYVVMFRGERKGPTDVVPLEGAYLVGEYDDEYQRTETGWRIARRRPVTAFRRGTP